MVFAAMLSVRTPWDVDELTKGEVDLYYSKNPSNFYMSGAADQPHLTLHHGFHDAAVLAEWQKQNPAAPAELRVCGVVTFDSHPARVEEGESPDYRCVVARVEVPAESAVLRLRSKVMKEVPNQPSHFLSYTPHITIAYVANPASAQKVQQSLQQFVGQAVVTTEWKDPKPLSVL